MSYFFQNGKIYVVLNKLEKLSTDDYDSIGTAKMVIKTLCDTLGIGESKLAQILKHFVYDGVYAGKNQFYVNSLQIYTALCTLLIKEKIHKYFQGITYTFWNNSTFSVTIAQIMISNLAWFENYLGVSKLTV